MLPPMVQKTIGRALKKEGTKERVMILQAVGLLPSRMDWWLSAVLKQISYFAVSTLQLVENTLERVLRSLIPPQFV
jgi:hypothetical protein